MSLEDQKNALVEKIAAANESLLSKNGPEESLLSSTAGESTPAGLSKVSKVKCGVSHASKISSTSWWKDSEHALVVLQDGKMIVHNMRVPTKSARYLLNLGTWLMTSDFNRCGDMLAVGGLDNLCTIFKIPDFSQPLEDPCPTSDPKHILEKHGGYLNCCKWITDTKIITGSGDSTSMMWDLGSQDRKAVKEPNMTFTGHTKDVCAVATWEGEENTFLSASQDSYCKLWDLRVKDDTNSCVSTYMPGCDSGKGGATSIKKLYGVDCFVSGHEDGAVRLWDMRSQKCVQKYSNSDEVIQAVEVSKSNRLLYAGSDSGKIEVFDMLTGDVTESLEGLQQSVTSIDIAPNGRAMMTSSRNMTSNFQLYA